MGICNGKNNNSGQSENAMKQRAKVMAKEVKLLLLGSGESGKSTIFKQIKILRKNGFDPEEFKMLKVVVYSNITIGMGKLVRGAIAHGFEFNKDVQERVDRLKDIDEMTVMQMQNFETTFVETLSGDVRELWSDPAIQRAWEIKGEFHIDDGFEYYMKDYDRLLQPNYIPTTDDVLFLRVKTVGVTELQFEQREHLFRVVDVGGQRTERRKWLHHFEGVTAVLYVTALSDYCQLCMEDNATNRMAESLTLFDSVVNNPYFTKTPIIIFFNKTDIFRKRLETEPISKYYPEFQGPNDFDTACQFILDKFTAIVKAKNKAIYPHFTCATDTTQVQDVLVSVEDILVSNKKANDEDML